MELREKLYQALIDHPRSIAELAKECGLNVITVTNFLKKDNYPLSFKNKLVIEKWLRDKENK
jgi:hypothetical protein